MEIKEQDILDKTHYGLNIYSHILRLFYPNDVVLHLHGKQCETTKNPFLRGSETLQISNHNWIFLFEDTSNLDFKGNPFDFAAHYYKLSGSELLTKLNEELNLGLGKKHPFYSKVISENSVTLKDKFESPKFSFFNRPVTNTTPSKVLSLLDVYKLVKSNNYKNITLNYRQIQDKVKSREYKALNFDYVTFSGVFKKRNDNDLLKHSDLITIDFDHTPDIEQLKKDLLNDEYFETELLFTSPSGDGLKWIIPIDLTQGSHQFLFSAISAYIKKTYRIDVDKSGRDISRACFLPFDANIYINPKYLE